MDDIDDLLKRQAAGIKLRELVPQTIQFTEGAYKKADMLGPLIKGLTDRDLEWSGFMLASKKDPDYVVRDILLEKGQDITNGIVTIEGQKVAKTMEILKQYNERSGQDLYVIGWIHGHGTCPLQPSGTDRDNFETVLNTVSLNTEHRVETPLKLIETDIKRRLRGNRIVYSGSAVEDCRIEHILDDEDALAVALHENGIRCNGDVREKGVKLLAALLSAGRTNYHQPTLVGFSYFVIVNNSHDAPYSAIAASQQKAMTREIKAELYEKVPLEKLAVENDIAVTEQGLEAEVKRFIKLPKKPMVFKPFQSYGPIGTFFGDLLGGSGVQVVDEPVSTPVRTYYGGSYDASPYFVSQRLVEGLEAEAIGSPDGEKAFIGLLKAVDIAPTQKAQRAIIRAYFTSRPGYQKPEEPKAAAPTASDTHPLLAAITDTQKEMPKPDATSAMPAAPAHPTIDPKAETQGD